MASYVENPNRNQMNQPNIGYFSKMLRKLSSYGTDYDDMVIRNTYSIGAHEDAKDASQLGGVAAGPAMYDLFTKKIIAKVLDKKSIAYLDRTYFDKRKILRQYSIKDEIKDFVNVLADESIIFDDRNFFCNLIDLPEDFDYVVRQKQTENFQKIYNAFGFNDGITAWNYYKDLLIDGFLSFEIIFDSKQKNIIGLQKIDPITLVVATDPMTNTIVWVQYPDNPQMRRILLDSQIIYISYSNNYEYGETSYIESLIRPYNQLKLLEQSKLLYNINQASIYKKFIIPTNGLTRQQAEQQIFQLMSEYHEDVQWDDQLGTVSINGSPNIPHSKDYWFPSSEGGTPDVSIENPTGIDLNEDSVLKWFDNNLKRSSRIPGQRFDKDSGGGNIISDAAEITRDEMKFKNFTNRIRTVFKEIISKPIFIQMVLDFPELKDDILFKTSLKIEFVSINLFEEWKQLQNMAKRAEIVSTLTSNFQGADGQSYFHPEWLARNIMKLTEQEIEENNKYKMNSPTQGGEGGEGGAPGGGGGGGMEFGGGGEMGGEFGGGEMGGAPGGGQAQMGGAQMGGQTQTGGGQAQTGGGGGQAQTPPAQF